MDSDDDQATDYTNDHQYPDQPPPQKQILSLVGLQSAEIISICIVSFTSPFIYVISIFFRRLFLGLLAAAYVCIVLLMVMAAAAALGVGLVGMWLEEPVSVRESLQLDYTNAHPSAVFTFPSALPVGQTLYVSLILVVPETEYNFDIGIFQLSAELASIGGEMVAKASHPCMLRFTSPPIRAMRTLAMGIPLLLGVATETQNLLFPILSHKETHYPRTHQVRITLFPRAGTSSLPQFYNAVLVVESRLPWTKQLVYSWKWTLYVWATLYIFLALVALLVTFLKPLLFPVLIAPSPPIPEVEDSNTPAHSGMQLVCHSRESVKFQKEREVSESIRRWQRSRNKRKAALLHGAGADDVGDSSASSIRYAPGDDTGPWFEEGTGDSESVCFES